MPRANRHFLPGYVWHITHRCHKGEFLLKFARDQRRWLQWVFEAKKRFGVLILNYCVTSNHVHLIMKDAKGRDAIPRTMQLVAGRTGQEYNLRKNRKGAFREDRYHEIQISYELREPPAAYEAVLDAEKGDLRQKNAFFWDIYR